MILSITSIFNKQFVLWIKLKINYLLCSSPDYVILLIHIVGSLYSYMYSAALRVWAVKLEKSVVFNSLKSRCSFLQDLFTAASAQLYKSTKNHLYFKDITIVIPKSWPNNIAEAFVSGAQVDTAHVIVDKPNPLVDNKPYVSGMTGCGQPGKHIHLEPFTVQILAGLAGKTEI